MTTVVIFGVIVAIAATVGVLDARRRPQQPTRTGYAVPHQLDRADFTRPEAPWIVVLFSSATCNSCAKARQVVEPLDGPVVATQDVELVADRALHDRYQIEAVPTIVVADADGVVRQSFLGVPTAADLWGSLAELRDPGSVPASCDHGTPPARSHEVLDH